MSAMAPTDDRISTRLRTLAGRLRKHLLSLAEQLAYDVSGLTMALPFRSMSKAHNAETLHQFYRRHFWSQSWGVARGLLAVILWLPALIFTTMQYTARNGQAIRTRSGKSPATQMLEQVGFAWSHARNSAHPALGSAIFLHDPRWPPRNRRLRRRLPPARSWGLW